MGIESDLPHGRSLFLSFIVHFCKLHLTELVTFVYNHQWYSVFQLERFGFMKKDTAPSGTKKILGLEVFLFLAIFFGLFVYMGSTMGAVNMINTLMNTAFDLLLNTVFYLMAIAVLVGAISGLFTEFGVIALLNKLLSRAVEKIYGLPGASAVGVFTTYLSDNPAILALSNDKSFRRFFKKYQLPALCNLGTAFGMGLIISTSMISMGSPSGESFVLAVLIGNLGAIVGSIVSTRLMLRHTTKIYGKDAPCEVEDKDDSIDINRYRQIRSGGLFSRFLDAMLEGGKNGVQMGRTSSLVL